MVDPVTWFKSSTASRKIFDWTLNTYTNGYVQDPQSGFATEYAQYCFDAKGRILRQRTMAGGSPGSSDQLTVHTYDSLGNRIRDEQFGGNLNSVGLSAVCSAAVSHNNHTYRIDHTWIAGSPATSRSMYGSWASGFNHYEVDREIDQNTGLTRADWVSRSFGGSDGIRTAYEYDGLGRLTWTKPAAGHDAWRQNVYTRATSASAPASVQILHYANGSTSSPIAQAKYDFDAFGRVLREGMLGANGAWMYRETQRNGAGWAMSVSEWDAVLSPYWRTFYTYDWSGRLTAIQPPVGQATTIGYTGGRVKSTTQRLATDASGNETAATTTEESDMLGRLTAVVEPNGIRTTYAYDAGNRLRYVCSNQSAGCVQQRWFTYDGRGLLTAEYHPERYATTYSAFDARGNATTISVSSGFSYNYTFDRAGRLTKIQSGGRPVKEFVYATGNSGYDRRNGKVEKAKRWNWHDRFGIYGLVTETYRYEGRGGRPSNRSTAVETFDYYPVLQGSKTFDQAWSWHDLGGPLVTGYPVCGGMSPCNVVGARNLTHDYTNGWLTGVREGSSSW
ncbi:MAG: RHS repeat protein, partial [Thioalkalivibrio sp.]|nr:RHS repeat protein [Thioalkalivibrio sp.]